MAWGHSSTQDQGPAYGGAQTGSEMAAAVAEALGAGAAEAANTNVGAVVASDTQSGTSTRMEDEGLIAAGTPTSAQGFTSPGYVNQVQTHEEMYPGHRKMAASVGATGLGFFTKARTDMINNNKAQMRSMGIQPSHKNNAGELTGRYSSGDWKAFVAALGGGTMATEQGDDEMTMEDTVARTAAIAEGTAASAPSYDSPYLGDPNRSFQAGTMATEEFDSPTPLAGTPVQVGMGPGYADPARVTPEEAAMGMPAPLGGGASPYVDDFSAYGQQVQPGVTSQVDMGTGYAPAPMTGPEQFTNYTAATTPMSGVQMTAPGQSTVGAPGASWGDYDSSIPTRGNIDAATALLAGGSQLAPGAYADMTTEVDSFRNMPATSPGITSPITGPEQFGDYQRGVAQGYPFAGPQMTAPGQSTAPFSSDYGGPYPEDQASQYGAINQLGDMGYQYASGNPMVGRTTQQLVEDQLTGGGAAATDSFTNIPVYGEMDEGTLDPNAGLISRGTQADTGQLQAAAMLESITEAVQTIADKPIADGTDAPELIKNNVSSGGTNESRVEDLVKAGFPKNLIDLMEDSAVAMLHFSLTETMAKYPNEKVTFNDLIPSIQKMNLSPGGNKLMTWSDSDFAAGVQAEKDFEIGKGK